MKQNIGTYNFKDRLHNSYFNGLRLKVTKTIDDITTPYDLTGVDIVIDFKVVKTGVSAQTLTIGNGVTIEDVVNGIFKIDGGNITLEANDYFYDVKLTNSNGDNLYWLEGKRKIIQNTTD